MTKKPMDVEIEVLAAIMFDPKKCTYAFELLRPEHFVNKKHAKLYEEMCELYDTGHSLDVITLSENSDLDELIMEVATLSYTTHKVKSHCNILLDRWYLLEARQKLIDAVKSLEDIKRSPEKLRVRCEEIAAFLADRVKDKGLEHVSKISISAADGLSKIEEGLFPGVMSGFTKLDEMGFYFRNKTFNVLAARPGMGKSAFILKLAMNCKGVSAIYSLEMSKEEEYERLISMETGLTNDDLRDKDKLKAFAPKILDSMGKINQYKMYINDSTRITLSMIHNQTKRLKAQEGLDILFVDWLGLMKSEQKFNKRYEEIGSLSKGLKNIGNELNIPVIAVHQLNRKLEDRTNKRPILSDLRESGDIEQDAHQVWFLYRGEKYGEKTAPGATELIIEKNRSGKTGMELLTFKKAETNFVDYMQPSEADADFFL